MATHRSSRLNIRHLVARLLDRVVGPQRYELVVGLRSDVGHFTSSRWFRTARAAHRYETAGAGAVMSHYRYQRAEAVALGYDPEKVPVPTQQLVDHGPFEVAP